jgi:hypothetical protein
MKVNIGPYKSFITTHRTKCKYLELMYGDEWIDVKKDQYIWIDHIVVGILDGIDFCLKPINKFRKRKEKVKYDSYDTWSLDHTLSLIILPGLKQLKDTNHGYGSVDYNDLPTACLKDASGEEQWEWIMDEMIWAFNEISKECPGEQAFYSGKTDLIWTKSDNGDYSTMGHGPNHTFSIDREGLEKYNDRINRGLILFGKYYRSLWD